MRQDETSAQLQLIEKIEAGTLDPHQLAGIFHFSNEGVCSWYDFAQTIFELKGIPIKLNPIETIQYPTPAQRPFYSLLNKNKMILYHNIIRSRL